MDLRGLIAKQQRYELNQANASAKVCQDIILKAIAKSNMGRNTTIKGGVVMRSISGNVRRATQDIDIDFIRYSLSDESIQNFIGKLNCLDGIVIELVGDIEELKHEDYHGRRVNIIIKDGNGYTVKSKIDLGVHHHLNIEQQEYCFDVCLDDVGASVLINSKEQMFAEKLKGLLRLGTISTRYKDVFDLCYLADYLNKELLLECFKEYIFNDELWRENCLEDISKRIENIFNDKGFRDNLSRTKVNWLEITSAEVMERVMGFLKGLQSENI